MDPFRNLNTFKIDPITEIRNAGIVTNGRVLWVKDSGDPDFTTFKDAVGADSLRETVNAALDDRGRSDTNDYVLVTPKTNGGAYALGTAIDLDLDRIHLRGVANGRPEHSYAVTFEGYAVAGGVDTELLNVTGAGCEIGNLAFVGTSGTHANGTITALARIGTAASGTPHDTWFHDVRIENTQAAADNGTAFIVNVTGDVATGIRGLRFDNAWLGNWSWAPAAVVNFVGTAGPTRAEFHNTTFVIDAQATTDDFVVWGTGQTEYGLFKNCDFINVEAGTLPASVFTGAVLADNPVLLRNCSYVNVTQAGTDTEVFKSPAFSGTAAAITDVGIAIGTAAIIPA